VATASRSTDSAITDRLHRAVLVVKGRVLSVQHPALVRPGPRSEHSPEWRQANVEVSETLKGSSKEKTIPVLFSSSSDIVWYRSHKFKPGEEGIFILEQPAATYGLQGFTALDPLDFQPVAEESRVRRLLQAIR
jgi:hypothetical protein